jgi:hypothetical protein
MKVKLGIPTVTAFATLDTQHRTISRVSGYRAEESAADFADTISGSVGRYVSGRGPVGEALVCCNNCGATFPETTPEWDEVIPGLAS